MTKIRIIKLIKTLLGDELYIIYLLRSLAWIRGSAGSTRSRGRRGALQIKSIIFIYRGVHEKGLLSLNSLYLHYLSIPLFTVS